MAGMGEEVWTKILVMMVVWLCYHVATEVEAWTDRLTLRASWKTDHWLHALQVWGPLKEIPCRSSQGQDRQPPWAVGSSHTGD